tara:strand:- start:40033 stop:40338 length:306 start_codon:yes stop_codon:yes gene_type:complete
MSNTQNLAEFAKDFENNSTNLHNFLDKLEDLNSGKNNDLFEIAKEVKNNSRKFSPNTLKSVVEVQRKIAQSMSEGEDFSNHIKVMKSLVKKTIKKKRKLSL